MTGRPISDPPRDPGDDNHSVMPSRWAPRQRNHATAAECPRNRLLAIRGSRDLRSSEFASRDGILSGGLGRLAGLVVCGNG